ncbi:IS1182 family transposase [Salinibacter ruber]|uniref:IS1182 family transposase n=1 Tax=Salinibacter ruber TaxID=146919 RepID=UPI002166FB0B|nr:IS1182 family transposase [Salinibacter ruber]MCS4198368.1 transposase [Salinibacter ruber]
MPEKQFRDWNPDQPFLLPPSLQEWLPEDHPVYMMLDILEELDISAIEKKYRQKDPRGTRPYAPKMMVGLLLYGYSVGIRSSRKLEKATYEDIPFRVLTAGNHPDHTRISEFRRKYLDELEDLFLQVFQICQRMGLVELGNVALDGTKVQANASKHKAMSYERMLEEEERLKEEIEEMLEEAEAIDRAEDERFGRENRGDELPEELERRRDRLEKIQEAKADLEKEAKQGRAEEVQAKADRASERAETHESKRERKRSLALAEKWDKEAEQLREEASGRAGQEVGDPETPEGMPKHRPKTEADGTPESEAQRNFTDPDSRIMEKGGEFLQGYNCQLLVDEANQIIVAQGVTNQSPDNGNFGPMTRKGTQNAEVSPEAVLADSGYWSEEAPKAAEACGTEAYVATGRQPHGKKTPSRSGDPPEEATAQERMSHKLRTRDGLDRYALRKSIVEPVNGQIVNGQIKEIGGFRRFSLHGYQKVRREWALVCTGHNLKKLIGAMQAGQCEGGALR